LAKDPHRTFAFLAEDQLLTFVILAKDPHRTFAFLAEDQLLTFVILAKAQSPVGLEWLGAGAGHNFKNVILSYPIRKKEGCLHGTGTYHS
ncbi:hypothetical protein, partial [Alteribacillus iranensis]